MTILHLSVTWDTGHLCSQRSCQGKTCSFASSSAQHWCASLVLFVKDQVLFLSLVYQNYFCPHLNLCWKSRVQRKKDVCPRPQTPLSCAHSSLGWTYADTQDRPIRTDMERAEENYLRLPFRAWCLPAVEKSQQRQGTDGFYHDTGRMKLSTLSPWGLNFHQATSTWFSRKLSLRSSQLDKVKNKGQSCSCLHCTMNPGTSLGICWLPSRHQYFSARNMFHVQIMLCLIIKHDVPQRLHGVPAGFVPFGKAEADMLVVLQVFSALPPAVSCHAYLGEKLESSSNILQMFSLRLHNFIYVKGRIIKEKKEKDWGRSALYKCISQWNQNADKYPPPMSFSTSCTFRKFKIAQASFQLLFLHSYATSRAVCFLFSWWAFLGTS